MIKLTILYIIVLVVIIAMVNHGGSDIINILGRWVYRVPYGDKVGHFVLMGFLSFAVNSSLKGKKFKLFGLPILLGSFLVFILVTLEEISQIFIVARTFDSVDLLADYLGIFLFGQMAWYLSRRKASSKK